MQGLAVTREAKIPFHVGTVRVRMVGVRQSISSGNKGSLSVSPSGLQISPEGGLLRAQVFGLVEGSFGP